MNAVLSPPQTQSRSDIEVQRVLEQSPLGASFAETPNPVTRYLAVELAFVWDEFVSRLNRVPVVRAVEDGSVSKEQYAALLLNLRQQVIDGGRWIALTASSMSQELFIIRSALITHAAEEHRDYQMLEDDYVALGGKRADIESAEKNIGSEAFSAFMFQRAAQPDPLDLFGAMFIIEGLGSAKAGLWAKRLQASLGLERAGANFLLYHGQNDDNHYNKLRMVLSLPFITETVAKRLVKTARTVARLYCLQLEELGNV
ncbi:MAG: hypothetical protein AB7S68_39680 [Polyangiaceae bacterium]